MVGLSSSSTINDSLLMLFERGRGRGTTCPQTSGFLVVGVTSPWVAGVCALAPGVVLAIVGKMKGSSASSA